MDAWPDFVIDDDHHQCPIRIAGPIGELTGWETVIFELDEEQAIQGGKYTRRIDGK